MGRREMQLVQHSKIMTGKNKAAKSAYLTQKCRKGDSLDYFWPDYTTRVIATLFSVSVSFFNCSSAALSFALSLSSSGIGIASSCLPAGSFAATPAGGGAVATPPLRFPRVGMVESGKVRTLVLVGCLKYRKRTHFQLSI